MSDGKMTIGAVALGAWRRAFAALAAQRAVAATAFLALTLIYLPPRLLIFDAAFGGTKPADPLSPAALATTLQTGTIGLASALIASLALTPLAIAVHRFILLGETTSSYRIELGVPRFRRFAFYTFILNLIALTPGASGLLFVAIIRSIPPAAVALLGLGIALGAVAGGIVIVVLGVRLILLFPAIAVDAPRAGWNRALDESSGQFWRILSVLVLTALIGIPVIVGGTIAQAAAGLLIHYGYPAPGALVSGLGRAATNMLIATAFVAAASLLYCDEVKRPSLQDA